MRAKKATASRATTATPPAAPRRSRQEILAEIQLLVQQLAESMEARQA